MTLTISGLEKMFAIYQEMRRYAGKLTQHDCPGPFEV